MSLITSLTVRKGWPKLSKFIMSYVGVHYGQFRGFLSQKLFAFKKHVVEMGWFTVKIIINTPKTSFKKSLQKISVFWMFLFLLFKNCVLDMEQAQFNHKPCQVINKNLQNMTKCFSRSWVCQGGLKSFYDTLYRASWCRGQKIQNSQNRILSIYGQMDPKNGYSG